MLVGETACTYEQYLSTSRKEESEEHQTKMYRNLVPQGKLQTVVWCITERKMFQFSVRQADWIVLRTDHIVCGWRTDYDTSVVGG